jgi:hypothetical protein
VLAPRLSLVGLLGDEVRESEGVGLEYERRRLDAAILSAWDWRFPLAIREKSASSADYCAGAGGGWVGCVNETATGSRSAASVISKNSRGVKPPLPATTEFGKIWIFVL